MKTFITLLFLAGIFQTLKANFECGENLGLVPNPQDCQSFYYCDSTGTATLEYCFDDLLFDENILVCNYENDVECGDRPLPDHQNTTIAPTTPTITPPTTPSTSPTTPPPTTTAGSTTSISEQAIFFRNLLLILICTLFKKIF